MSPENSCGATVVRLASRTRRLRATIVTASIVLGAFSYVSAQELPGGDAAQTVRGSCLTCHGTDVIAQQRLSRDGWSREIDKMVGWGAVVETAERERLLDYLAATFGVISPTSEFTASDAGAAVLKTRCAVCHDLRPIEQQRLDAAGWRREVDKMIGWGAVLADLEKEALVAHLARRYPAGSSRIR